MLCYECRMVVDSVLAFTRDPSLRASICSCPHCGEVFMKPDNLELHQAVRHAVESKFNQTPSAKGKRHFDYGPFGVIRTSKSSMCSRCGGIIRSSAGKSAKTRDGPQGTDGCVSEMKGRHDLKIRKHGAVQFKERCVSGRKFIQERGESSRAHRCETWAELQKEIAYEEAKGKFNGAKKTTEEKRKGKQCSMDPADAQILCRNLGGRGEDVSTSVHGHAAALAVKEEKDALEWEAKQKRALEWYAQQRKKMKSACVDNCGIKIIKIRVRTYDDSGDEGLEYTMSSTSKFEFMYNNYASLLDVDPNKIVLMKGRVAIAESATPSAAKVNDGDVLTVHGVDPFVNTDRRAKTLIFKRCHNDPLELVVRAPLEQPLKELWASWARFMGIVGEDFLLVKNDFICPAVGTVGWNKLKNGDTFHCVRFKEFSTGLSGCSNSSASF